MGEINWNDLTFFSRGEFDHPDEMDPQLLSMLDVARSIAGVSFVINSDFRTPAENKAAGGKPHSAHLKGLAVDIACNGSRNRYRILKGLYRAKFSRIGLGKTFIHADIDENLDREVCWQY